MSDKVKLPKEVASVLEDLINRGDLTIYGVLEHFTMNCQSHVVDARKILEKLEDPWSLVMIALVNGFEVIQTPEDKVRDYIDHLKSTRDRSDLAPERCRSAEYSGRIDSVLQTLSLLNIKIEGVNA